MKKPRNIFQQIVLISGIILASTLAYQLYLYIHPRINFTEYAPSKVVDGLTVDQKYLEVWTVTDVLWFAPYDHRVVLGLNRSNSFIAQSKDDGNVAAISCSAKIANEECVSGQTPGGQKYSLTLTYDPSDLNRQPMVYDKLAQERIMFAKNGTRFIIQIAASDNDPVPEADWGAMIDSFSPTHFTDLKVQRHQPGP